MILVDTNVVSEAMLPVPNLDVIRWFNEQADGTLYLSTISLAELLVGVAFLPLGKRRDGLAQNLTALMEAEFPDRKLSFDEHAAVEYARIISNASRRGLAISKPDGQIAAIAAAHGFAVATRDTSPFLAAGLTVINPWTA